MAARCLRSASNSIRARCSITASGSRTCAPHSRRPTPTAPRAALEDPQQHFQLYVNDTARDANAYRPLIIAYRNNAPVRLGDIATVTDGVENVRNLGLFDGKPSVLVIIHKQPGANVIDVSDRVAAVLPQLQASIPQSIVITRTHDRTGTIRAALHDVEMALLIASALVVLVVYLALRNPRAALIPSVAVPLALIGTFGAMYVFGFSLDNLSLMALTVATGFVVDDAIVMLENIARHLEAGLSPFQAAMKGSREVGFTVLAMTLSLIAVFLPILLMGGLVGRVFREFAMTLSVAILLSLLISVTTTPMMCAHVLGRMQPQAGALSRSDGAWLRCDARLLCAHAAGRSGSSRVPSCWCSRPPWS